MLAIPVAVVDGLVRFLQGIWDTVASILSFLSGIVSAFADMLGGLLQSLFVPEAGFLDKKFDSVKETLASRFTVGTYKELLKSLEGYVSGSIDFGGYIDIGMWKSKIPMIKNFVRAFFYPLIIIGDFNYLIWLLRGTKDTGDDSGQLSKGWDWH